ncbi:MAG TPA: FtsX-like permease family protein, partial [Chryseolinea sp.]|nr:FtsX-like permease family protein [Chryseolinea sp.]
SFKPITALKGKVINTASALTIRKALVVFQFTISIVLILGAILIRQQMSFLASTNLGFSKNQKIILPIQTTESESNSTALKTELSNITGVVSTAKGGSYPGIETITSMQFYAEGKVPTDNVELRTTYVELDYTRTLGIKVLQGRVFSPEFTGDEQSILLNESAIRDLGYTLDNAVGKKVYYDYLNVRHEMSIIGIVADYHFESLHQKIRPLVLTMAPFFSGPNRFMILDVKTSNYNELLATIEKTWSKINPGSPFNYSFLDQDFQKNYEKEGRTSQIIQYFTLIAIGIACLGLFGLAAFTAEQRIKEIGVRKVLGASVSQIVGHLSRDFMKLVAIAIILSCPLAYYFMNSWLQNFAYHIDIAWWVFIVAGLLSSLIALFTISLQTVKAALANPVKSLRSE